MMNKRRLKGTHAFLRICAVTVAVAIVMAGCSGRRSQQYTEQGDTLLRLGKTADALELYDQALMQDADNTQAQLGKARCLAQLNRKDEAGALYDQVLAKEPNNEQAYVEGVQLHIATGDTAKAEAMAQKLQELDAERGGLLMAHIMRQTGRNEEALRLLKDLTRNSNSSNLLIALASALTTAGDFESAESELKTVIEGQGPQALYARMMLVDVYQRQGRVSDLVAELRKLSSERPTDNNLKLALARGLVAAGQIDEAESIARPVLEETPESPWANYVMGVCLIAKEDFQRAAECLQIAAAGLPDVAEVSQQLLVAQSGGTVSSAMASGAESVEASQDFLTSWQDGRVRDLLANREALMAGSPDPATAEALTLAAIFFRDRNLANSLSEKLPADSNVKQYLSLLQQGDPQALIKFLDSWQEPEGFRTQLKLNAEGFAYALIGARARALDRFAQSVRLNPQDGMALYNVSSMYRHAGMPRFAARTLQQLIAAHPGNLEARELLFQALVDSGLQAEARQSAEATYAVFPDSVTARVNLAQVYLMDGEPDFALQVLETGVRDNPNDATLRLALAEARLSTGDVAAARDLLSAIADPPAAVAASKRLLAMAEAIDGQWEAALGLLTGMPDAELDSASRFLFAAAQLQNGATDEAKASVENARATDMNGQVLQAAMGVETSGLDEESTQLAEALKGNEKPLQQYAFALALRAAKLNDNAVQILRSVEETVPNQPALVGFLLNTIAADHSLEDPVALGKAYTEKYPEMAAAWVGLANIYLAEGNAVEEEAALRKAVAAAPQYGPAWRRLADVMSTRDDAQGLVQVLRNVLEVYPDDPVVCNNLAYTLLRTDGDPAEAVKLAETAAEKLQQNPQVLHTLGLAHFKAGDVEKGQKELAIALQARPGDPTLLLDYGQALIAQGNGAEGKQQIERAIAYANQLGLDFPRRAEAESALNQS